MKRIYILAILTTVFSLFAQAQQSFFDKYAEMEGVTSVYISKSMLGLMPNADSTVNGIHIGNIASRLDNIQILSCEEANVASKLRKETAKNTSEKLCESKFYISIC